VQNTTTRIDVIVPALLASWRAAFPAASVLDGPRAAQVPADDVLIVGAGNGENSEAYDIEVSLQDGLTQRPLETSTINCELSTWTGDQTAQMAPLRSHLAAMLATIDTALRVDQQLGGACDRIWLGPRARWWVLQSDDGAGMGIGFSVTAQAWL